MEIKKRAQIGEEAFAPILKTGDRFTAWTKLNGEMEYEFIGFAPFCSTGCFYIIIRNIQTDQYIGVEHLWFNREVTGRIITIKHKKRGRKNDI